MKRAASQKESRGAMASVVAVVVAMGLTLSVATVQADPTLPTLDFGIVAPTTGTISFAGGGAPLVGAGISVDNVTGLDTPLNNGLTAACVMCALNFTTGGFSGVNSSSGDFLFFGGGGSISAAAARLPSREVSI